MQFAIVALVVVAGLGLPVQDALNSMLRGSVKSPIIGALVATLFGAAALLALACFGVLGKGKVSDVFHAPWYAIVGGGLLSVFAVVAGLVAIPKLSAGLTITGTVFGELIAAMIIDHFGWLGVPRVPLNPWRVTGAVLLVAAAVLMQHK